MTKRTFATQSQLNRFPNNSCKFRKFQTVVKHFLKLYGAQISFKFVTGICALKCVGKDSTIVKKNSEFRSICMENQSSVTRWQELLFSYI